MHTDVLDVPQHVFDFGACVREELELEAQRDVRLHELEHKVVHHGAEDDGALAHLLRHVLVEDERTVEARLVTVPRHALCIGPLTKQVAHPASHARTVMHKRVQVRKQVVLQHMQEAHKLVSVRYRPANGGRSCVFFFGVIFFFCVCSKSPQKNKLHCQ